MENELLLLFKEAATSVTQLYRQSSQAQQRAYQQGYRQALQECWSFLQETQKCSPELAAWIKEKYEHAQMQQVKDEEEFDLEPKRRSVVEEAVLKRPRMSP